MPNLRLLRLSAREWRHHPWRHALVLLAVALGVALAWSVQLINQSALAEFAAAVRSANGEPDASVRGPRDGFDDTLFDTLAAHPAVVAASPVVEVDTYARREGGPRVAVRLLGVDALAVAAVAPELLPQPHAGAGRLAALDPELAFVNATARAQLRVADGDTLQLQSGPAWRTLRVAGVVAAGGPPLVVTDIAGAQATFGWQRRLSRIDLRLAADGDAGMIAARLPPGVALAAADADAQRMSRLSRAYRVNLTALAMVALFVGSFLVYAVVSLSVAQRTPSFALLGVLGLTARERRGLVLAECALAGLVGSLLGLALGAGLALAALRLLGGDLGGGFFTGVAPRLQLDAVGALLFLAIGTGTAVAAGWLPAREAERLAPAQALKGLGGSGGLAPPAWPGWGLVALGVGLSFVPPVAGLPLAAYAGVAALLFGGVLLVPAVVHGLLAALPHPRRPLVLLAARRARFQRRTATAAVAGVVASLALAVALTVMVTSFRDSVAGWLDTVLPADLYARAAGSSAAADQAWFGDDVPARAAALPGVQRVQAGRVRALRLDPALPTVALVARDLAEPDRVLPLTERALPATAGEVGVFVSEAMVALYGARPGQPLVLPIGRDGAAQTVRVRGVWRDFARQFGTVAIDLATYRVLSSDPRLTELSLWLAPGAEPAAVRDGVRSLQPDPSLLEFVSATELRALSLRIFDRSFAVTVYLQAVAIGIGLVGIGASLSAQVLARRKEFGLLAHLGLTRSQVVAVVAGEGAAWLAAGIVIGLGLGIAVSVVLVHVVNPQSFHWTMDLVLPWPRLALLAAAVAATGLAAAAFAARGATSQSVVVSVKDDW